MHGDLVALDLETTGLDPANDAILEMAAVRLRDGQIVEEYATLIDPQRSIPDFITQLTGITENDVMGKPRIAQVLPDFAAFVGDAPIIAHNITYDYAFLRKQGLLANNARIDTLELATALLPNTPRYALGSLAAEFGLELPHAHRALDDTRATALLYWRLWQRALALPLATLQEIVAAAGKLPWDAKGVFEAAAREVQSSQFTVHGSRFADSVLSADTSLPGAGYRVPSTLSSANTELSTQDPEPRTQNSEPAAVFAADGRLAALIPGYEARAGQVAMAAAVDEALRAGKHLMIEAATGIGKSLAYLAPALRQAADGERVVISTSTIQLQQQLMDHDLPLMRAALGVDVTAAVMKGRGNYLCPRRFAALRARGPATLDELRILARMLIWQLENTSGEKQDITLRGPTEQYVWSRLSAEDEDCTSEMCESIGGQCPFHRARRAADTAQVVVVNHALLVADALAAQHTLPEHNLVIIDEAHALEDATTDSLSFMLDAPLLKYRLADVSGKTRGLLADILRAVRTGAPEAEAAKFEGYGEIVRDAAKAMSAQIGALYEALSLLLAEGNGDRPDQQPIRIIHETRQKADFERATAVWRDLSEYFEAMSAAMKQLSKGLGRMNAYPIPDRANLSQAAGAAARFFQTTQAQLGAFIMDSDPNMVYWLERGFDNRGVALHGAPLHVGTLVDTHVWSARRSVIMTGATLQSAGGFDFLKERLSAQTVETMEIATPFDFKRAALVYLPTDLPEPNDRSRYQPAVERAIIELATALDGHVLVLFTSYTQLRQTAQGIAARLALGGIAVYDQADSGRNAMIDAFRSNPRGVLLGTRSFWEGVDLPGDLLRAVVIARLPFSVPTDPIFAARSDAYKKPFDDYSVPDAVLRFRQGFGRLIRSDQDRGVCVVLDGRILSKGYGKAFLEALPDVTLKKAPLDGMAQAAKAWVLGTEF